MQTFRISTRRWSARPRKQRYARETLKLRYEPGGWAFVTCRFPSTVRALKAQGWEACAAPPAPPAAAAEAADQDALPAGAPAEAGSPMVEHVEEPPQPPPVDVSPPAERREHEALLRLPPVDFYAVISGGAHDDQRDVLIGILLSRRGPGDAMRIAALLSRIGDSTERAAEAVRLMGQEGVVRLTALTLPPFAPAPEEPPEEPAGEPESASTEPEPAAEGEVLQEDAEALEDATAALEESAAEVEEAGADLLEALDDADPEVLEEVADALEEAAVLTEEATAALESATEPGEPEPAAPEAEEAPAAAAEPSGEPPAADAPTEPATEPAEGAQDGEPEPAAEAPGAVERSAHSV